MKSTAVILMITTILSKFLGLIRESVKGFCYGTGDVANAYVVAQIIPVIIFTFIQSGITTGYIPIYNRILKKDGEEAANNFTSNLGNIAFIISIIILILLEIFIVPVTKLFALGDSPETFQLSVNFTRITVFSIWALALATVYKSYLNANHSFVWPNLQGMVLNVFVIAAFFISYKLNNPIILPIGLCFALIVQHIVYIPAIKKTNFKYKFGIDLKDPYLKQMLWLAIPVIVGVAVNQINVIVDISLSSIIADNGKAIIDYSSRLKEFVNGIVVVSIGTVIYPTLSKHATDNNIDKFKDTILSSLTMINILVLPSVVGLIIYANPIVKLILERGAFTPEDTVIVGSCLKFYAISLIGMSIWDIVAKSFYSMQDTKTPTFYSILMVIINIILSITLSRFIGIQGLAVGTSIASIFGAVMLCIKLKQKLGKFDKLKYTLKEVFKMFLASIIMGGLSYIVYSLLLNTISSNTIAFFIAVIFAVIIYGILIILFKVEEAKTLIEDFKNKRNKK